MRQKFMVLGCVLIHVLFIGCGQQPKSPATPVASAADTGTANPDQAPHSGRLAKLTPEELLPLLQPSEPDYQAASAEVVRRGEALVAPLVKALESDKQWENRAAAAFGLGLLKDKASAALEPLKKAAAGDAEPTVRDAAQFALDAIAETK